MAKLANLWLAIFGKSFVIDIMLKFALVSVLLVSPLLAQAPAALKVPVAPEAEATHSANTPAHKLNAGWWKKRHEQKVAAAKGAECELLFIGDSITHGWENHGKTVWAEYYAGRKPFNIGFSGDKTEHVLWRFDNGELAQFKPKVAGSGTVSEILSILSSEILEAPV